MNIKRLRIKGYKSIGEIILTEPNPFSVFVGPNSAGKSNFFEALEFWSLCNIMEPVEAVKLFGNVSEMINLHLHEEQPTIIFESDLGNIKPFFEVRPSKNGDQWRINQMGYREFGNHFYNTFLKKAQNMPEDQAFVSDENYKQIFNFSRIFIGKNNLVKRNVQDNNSLALDGSNLEKVLKRVFQNETVRSEIVEILQLLVPGFKDVIIATEDLSGTDNLLVFEEKLERPFTKRLISDGTFNLISILAAIYQSERPQFLCIEEPENGLNPKVVRELVEIIRNKCKDNGHYIWLNTHSQTLVSELKPEEIILVDKVDGITQVKQITGLNLHGMRMDEALLTNSLGGGIPW